MLNKRVILVPIIVITSILFSKATNTDTIPQPDSLSNDDTIGIVEIAKTETVEAGNFQFLNDLDSLLSIYYVKQSLKKYEGEEQEMDSIIIPEFSDSVYIERLKAIPSVIALPYNDKVKANIDVYTKKRRKSVEVMLGLTEYYFPMFEQMLDAADLPIELKYLPVIESALNPRAVSRAGATGIWQFMYPTAKLYHLEINSLVDERRDPVKATEAAINYLKDMNEVYDDWTLALASYNCGPGNVNKAIRRSQGKRNFWEIYYSLPRETRGYVPAFVAATYVMHYYEEHGLKPRKMELPVVTDTIMVTEEVHLKQIAEVLKLPLQQLRDMNPQYRRDIIPGGKRKYSLKLPGDYATLFIDLQDSIYSYKDSVFFNPKKAIVAAPVYRGRYIPDPPSKDMTMLFYKVNSGDNVGYISSWYNVRASDLRYWNNIRGNMIRAEQKLIVYVHKSRVEKYKKINTMSFEQKQRSIGKSVTTTTIDSSLDKTTTTNTQTAGSNYVYYTVRSGDSPWTIAKKFEGVSESDILRLNNILNPKYIQVGERLKIKEK